MTPIYLLTTDPLWIILGFITQGFFAGAIYGQNPSYLAERFPTEVRSTASGFCYHQGAIFGGFVAPILTYFAINTGTGFAHSDAGRNSGRPDQLHPFRVGWPGNQGQGTGCRSRGFRDRGNSLIASSLSPFNGAAS